MMSMKSVEFGRSVLDLVACGCSSNTVLDRSSLKSYTKVNSKVSSRGYGARQVGFGGRDRTRCGVASMKAAETMINARYSDNRSGMAATNGIDEDVLQWVKKDNRRFLRANIRVGDLDRTLKFYTEYFGMKVLSRQDFQEEKYSTAVVAYGPQEDHFVLGLTHNHDPVEKLDIGTAFNHFGLATQDVYGTVEKIRSAGGTITREPGPIAEGGKTIFAFVNDPDGYSFELILRPPTPEPLCQVCLNVTDIDRSIEYYQKALGMNLLLQKYDAPHFQYTIAMVGYGSDFTRTTIIELKYNYNVKEYTKGNGYAMLAIGSDDVYKSGKAVEVVNKELGGKTIRPTALNPKTNTKITCFLDSDGFETVLVDNQDYADFNRKIQG